MRVVPDREMPAAGQVAALDQVAVGEQHRRFGFVGLDARRVDRHHVGPVGKIGDAAKTLGFALRAIGAARAIKAGKLGVGRRVDQRFDFEREGPVRRLRDGQAIGRRNIAFGRQRGAVELERHQRQPVAVEHQRRAGALRIGLERQTVARTFVCVGCSEKSRETVSTSQSGGR